MKKFRYSDTAADVAFLAMVENSADRRDLAELFVERYELYGGDTGLDGFVALSVGLCAGQGGELSSG